MTDDISTGKEKNLSEQKGNDRRKFLKYGAGVVVVAAAAAAGYYALQPAPGPPTTFLGFGLSIVSTQVSASLITHGWIPVFAVAMIFGFIAIAAGVGSIMGERRIG